MVNSACVSGCVECMECVDYHAQCVEVGRSVSLGQKDSCSLLDRRCLWLELAMPSSCCAVGCTTCFSKDKGMKLHQFPTKKKRLQVWIRAIKRKDWQPNQHSMVCSLHFISGKPSTDMGSPDYVPSIFAYNSKMDESKMARYQRPVYRRTSIVEPEPSSSGVVDNDEGVDTDNGAVKMVDRACMCHHYKSGP